MSRKKTLTKRKSRNHSFYSGPSSLASKRFLGGADLLLEEAFTLHEAGKMAEAIEVYRQILKNSPDRTDVLLNLAIAYHSLAEWDKAIWFYKRVLSIAPGHVAASFRLANAYRDQGLLEEAVRAYQQTINLEPANVNAIHNLGVAYFNQGRLNEAGACYKRTIALDPNYAQAHYNLGLVCYEQGRVDEAIDAWQRALEIDGQDVNSHYNLGMALAKSGNHEEAISSYLSALAIDPQDADLHYNLGLAYKDLQAFDEAISSFHETLAIQPGYAKAYSALGLVYHALGESEQATRFYGKAIDFGHDTLGNRHVLAALCGQKADTAPREYVLELFNGYAQNFEDSLVKQLEYNVPALMREAVSFLLPPAGFSNALDLGCGTGLSGQAFRDLTGWLTGLDLSPMMLAKAQVKNIYDQLQVGDVVEFLRETEERYDLIFALDVTIYLGCLDPLFKAVRARSLPRAYFLFSTESCEGLDYTLRPSGRFAHSLSYIKGLAGTYGFSIELNRNIGVRKERGEWIMGDMFALRRQ